MLYSKVISERCIACGLCQLKAPDLFDYDQEGIAFFKPDHNRGCIPIEDPKERIAFKTAYTACPTGAIVRQSVPFLS
ncbi:ferredoxin [Latilactobacillus graminis]|nr:ferredoxin [Latilactobacillus graminis]QFP79682.1 ferredoxin [Latilactobacillus graminis]